MINWFACLKPCGGDYSFDSANNRALLVERKGDLIRFGVESAGSLPEVSILRETLRCVQQSGVSRDAVLVWAFSSVAIPVDELGVLLERWDETDEPPVLSIIALELGEHGHNTRGVTGLVGYELAARFADPAQSRDAARNLVRLARHAMVNGGLDRDAVYQGVDDGLLNLDWSDGRTSKVMVTIVL